jgi:hypothetical protein
VAAPLARYWLRKRVTSGRDVREDAMEAAKKMVVQCSCGTVTDGVCAGCGKTVCSRCSTAHICSFDPSRIQIKLYCSECATDVRKNVWGELYWKELTSLFV